MKLSQGQRQALARLRENEGLTGNLTDAPASALLKWAETQIKANVSEDVVVSAVRAVNRRGVESRSEALAAAEQELKEQSTRASKSTSTEQPPPVVPSQLTSNVESPRSVNITLHDNERSNPNESESPRTGKRKKSRKGKKL